MLPVCAVMARGMVGRPLCRPLAGGGTGGKSQEPGLTFGKSLSTEPEPGLSHPESATQRPPQDRGAGALGPHCGNARDLDSQVISCLPFALDFRVGSRFSVPVAQTRHAYRLPPGDSVLARDAGYLCARHAG